MKKTTNDRAETATLTTARMKEAFDRSARAVELKPATAFKTATCRAEITDGYSCLLEEGRWRMVSDLHEKVGGGGLGPDPSTLGRAALASCAAIGYVQWAAVLEIPISGVEVVVETDHDYSGYYDQSDAPSGPLAARIIVNITSDAPESDIIRLVDKADHHSPLHDIWSRPIEMTREVTIQTSTD